MALPIVAAVAGQAIVQVFTKPWPWVIAGAWFITSNPKLGILASEARSTVYNLWWLVLLTITLLIVRQYLILMVAREKSARTQGRVPLHRNRCRALRV